MSSEISAEVTVVCQDRWQVYYRLQSLGIDCRCRSFKPLKVTVKTPTDALQLWSIVRSIEQPKQALIASIQQNWRAPAAKQE